MKMTTIALWRPMILSNVTNRMKCQIKKGNNIKHFHNSVCAKNPLAWTMDKGMGTTRNNDNDSKDQKWMTSNLGTKYQMLNGTLATLQGKLENLELKVENRALKENAEQKANNQTLEAKLKDEFAKMLANQNEQHQKEITQLESKYWKLEEKLSAVELQTREITTKGVIREKLLVNPKQNCWKESNPNFIISRDGLKVGNTKDSRENLCTEKGFDISGDSRQQEDFTGTTIYYFEVKQTSPGEFFIGLSDGSILAEGKCVGECPNSCGLANSKCCCISGEWHDFEWPGGATKPTRVGASTGDVNGCGLLLCPDNKLAIFFTMDGILIGKPIPISPSVHRLYPTVTMGKYMSLEANFGDDPAKPFSFDIAKCPNLIFP